jgi:hypothetical protein
MLFTFKNSIKRSQLNNVNVNFGYNLEKKMLNENSCVSGKSPRSSILFFTILKIFFSPSVPDNLGKESSFKFSNIRFLSIIV